MRLNRYKIGADVGGTFTDLVLFEENSQEIKVHKVPTVPQNQADGIYTGTSELITENQISPTEVVYLAQGSTIAINAMIEGKTAKVGLITTEGFRDLLELRRQKRDKLYDLFVEKPLPLVSRSLRIEVPERVNSKGEIVLPLDIERTQQAIQTLMHQKVDAIAVCFLFDFLNPAHELEVERIAKSLNCEASIWLAHKILPEFREFERLSTTVSNAALGPVTKTYLTNLTARISELGCNRPPYIMQSSGGIMSPSRAIERPANTLFSGPSGGVIGGLHVAQLAGIKDIITLDMGGTSTDVCLIRNGTVSMVYEKEISGNPVRTPMVDVNSVGAGGGSIAWIDSGGRLKVGPKSAGAKPGPASYGLGGEQPTLTDANLILGRLNAQGLLKGRMPLQEHLAKKAIDESIAKPLGLNTVQAAQGILDIINSNTVLATRVVSVQRGYDPRDFTLVAFGGAGPLHGTAVAKQLNMSKVIIPPNPGILCALGLLNTDMRADYTKTYLTSLEEADLNKVNSIIDDLFSQAINWLDSEDVQEDKRSIQILADLRYTGQNYELTIPSSNQKWQTEEIDKLTKAFNQAHEREYGYQSNNEKVQLVNIRVLALSLMPRIKPSPLKEALLDPIPVGFREVWWEEGPSKTPIFQREDLLQGHEIEGPAIIEQMDSTTPIAPKEHAVVETYGSLIISLD